MDKIRKIPKEYLIYVDESGMDQGHYNDKCYARRGEKVMAKVSGKRYARENFIAARVNGKTIAPMCYSHPCDTETFNIWLEKFLLPQLKPGQVIILDNASFHKSERTKKLIESAKCKLFFLPPYSPELNTIEKFWANLKRYIVKISANYLNLRDAVDAALKSKC